MERETKTAAETEIETETETWTHITDTRHRHRHRHRHTYAHEAGPLITEITTSGPIHSSEKILTVEHSPVFDNSEHGGGGDHSQGKYLGKCPSSSLA